MIVKQLTVFIENREGRLDDVTDVLLKSKVNIQGCSLAEATEYGVLRMIVDDGDNERAVKALKDAGFIARTVEVSHIDISNEPGSLAEFLKKCRGLKLNVEYMYGMSTGKDGASIIIKFSDTKEAEELLADS